jgi:methyl-accepting chemotaxis protein
MQAAGERLLEALREQGFSSYDDFMQMALATEMGSRAEKMAHIVEQRDWEADEGAYAERLIHCRDLDEGLESLFKQVGSFVELIGSLEAKSAFLGDLAAEIHLLSLNSLIAAHHLSDDGKGLAVVADDLARISILSSEVIGKMENDVRALINGLRATAFGISAAKLQVGMSITFLRELIEGDEVHPERMARDERDLGTLSASFAESMKTITAAIPTLREPMDTLIHHLRELAGTIRALSRVHLIGKIESSHLGSATTFQQVFEEVYDLLSSGKRELDEFVASIELLNQRLPAFARESKKLEQATLAA